MARRCSVLSLNVWQQIIPTWSVIEAKCPMPATIAVVGADARDDVAVVGRALAAAATAAGRSAGLLLLDPSSSASDTDGFDEFTMGSVSQKVFEDRCALWISRYDLFIIVVPQALTHVLGPHAMRASKAVVVAVSLHRRIDNADRALSNLLVQLGATTVGIVRTGVMTSHPRPPRMSSLRSLRKTLSALVFRT